MARSRTRKAPLWKTLPLWAAAGGLALWGLWQASEFRRTLLAEVQQSEALGVRPVGRKDKPDGVREEEAGADATAVPIIMGTEPRDAGVPVIAQGRGVEQAATIEVLDPLQEPLFGSDSDPHARGGRAGFADGPTFDPELTATELLERGTKLLDAGRVIEGRAALNAALMRATDGRQAAALRDTLSALNVSIFLGTAILPDDPAARYVDILPGDSFLKLGREFGVPASYLELINPSLNARNLKPLTGVKIVQGPFSVRVVKHSSRMDLYAREMYVRSIAIELPEGNFLPRGDYLVNSGTKIQVGSRFWIGFEGTEEASQAVGAGWIYGSAGPRGASAKDRASGIRVGDADLWQLYNVLVESRSHVRVEP